MACAALDQGDKEHHRKFMHKPLTPILNRLDYPLGKLGADRTEQVLMFPAIVDDISKALDELRAAIEERQDHLERTGNGNTARSTVRSVSCVTMPSQ